ncbi:MAG: M20/M25/M40 family metallo-hydrolase [Phycisphaerales bacterium]
MLNAACIVSLAATMASAQIDEARLMETLRSLPVPRAALGSAESKQNLAATEDLIEARLRELGYEVREEAFDWPVTPRRWGPAKKEPGPEQPVDAKSPANEPSEPAKPVELLPVRNLVAEIRGVGSPNQVLLVGAHFDGFEESGAADDNGTGTAALLELARSLKDTKPRRTIRLVFFTLEENGLVGSRRHLSLWKAEDKRREAAGEPRETIVGMMSLETIGYYTDEPDSQKSPIPPIKDVFEPPTVGNFIAITGIAKHREFSTRLGELMTEAQQRVPVMMVDRFPIAPPDLLRSDHAPFLLEGIPAVMITDTANFRNARYHKPEDTPDSIDGPRFARVVEALDHAIRGLADRE